MRSHQTRMKRYAQIIYMLSQCKDAIDNTAALFARMRRHEWHELRARIERLGRLTCHSRESRNLFASFASGVNAPSELCENQETQEKVSIRR